jgi:hypothetical protein
VTLLEEHRHRREDHEQWPHQRDAIQRQRARDRLQRRRDRRSFGRLFTSKKHDHEDGAAEGASLELAADPAADLEADQFEEGRVQGLCDSVSGGSGLGLFGCAEEEVATPKTRSIARASVTAAAAAYSQLKL